MAIGIITAGIAVGIIATGTTIIGVTGTGAEEATTIDEELT